jgi:peroxiredoxin
MQELCLAWATLLSVVGQIPTPTAPPPAAVPIGSEVGDVALPDGRGSSCRLADWQAGRVRVIAFVGVECPLAELYAGRLAELAAAFGPRGVAFVGLAPNRRDSAAAVDGYARAHGISFPIHEDRAGAVAARLGATRTPSVVVLDARGAVRYRGRIDDQYTLDAHRAGPRSRDLAGAIEALLAGRAVDRPETEAIGCPIDRPEAGAPDASATPPAPTYGRDVAPILRRRCVSCHSKGRMAPFGLTTYRQASGWAPAIAEAVEERRMPPWHADPAYGTFANDAHLSDREIRVVVDWARGGCPEGEPIEPLASAGQAEGWSIPGPDLVVAMTRPFRVPASGIVDYQEFEVDPGFLEDRWIVAAEVRPGNRAVVHHCNVFLKPPGASEPESTPGALGSICLAAAAAGTPPMILPPGMAKRVPAGWRLVFIVHYQPVGTEQSDQTRLGLNFAPPSAVRREVSTRLLYDADLCIPPRSPDHRVEHAWQAPADLLLLAMFPHMHLRGKSFRYEADYPDGTTETLLSVPHYDFQWQHRYALAEPKRIPAGTTLRCIAHYDNSAGNPANPDPDATVRTGKQSTDEMFNGYFDVALADDDPTQARLRVTPPRPAPRPLVHLSACALILAVCGLALHVNRGGRARKGSTSPPR